VSPMRIGPTFFVFAVLSIGVNPAFGSTTLSASVSVTDELRCYAYSAVGTSVSSAGFPPGVCMNGNEAATGSGSASASLTTLSIMASGNDFIANGLRPFDASIIDVMATSSRLVEVEGTGSGFLDFTFGADGETVLDTGNVGLSLTFDGQSLNPCPQEAFGEAICDNEAALPIFVTYGVPFQLTLTLTGNITGGAFLRLNAAYALTSGQDLIDVTETPEPNTASLFIFALLVFAASRWVGSTSVLPRV
jgi:hypothetical protein